jgi:hypothetical protein
MTFSISGFGHIVAEVADDVDPSLDLATEEARIGAEVVAKGEEAEKAILSDLVGFAKKHRLHLGGLTFSGSHTGSVDVVAAAAAGTDVADAPADTAVPGATTAADAPAETATTDAPAS